MKSAHLKGKGPRPHTNKQIDGKGKSEDPYFNYNMTILIGSSAEVTTRDGEVYEGIYVAFSSAMEILLEAAHLVTDSKDDASIEKHFDVLVIPSEKVLSMKCVNADLTYPTREFATDTAISSSRGGSLRDKELTPWECTEDTTDELSKSLDPASGGNSNGWEAKDMFKKNEEKYGVVSSFNHDLSGYTTQVDKNDTEYKRLEEHANQIASEIEKGTSSWERTQVENGDEEEAFSAVVRPRNNAPNSTVNNNNNNNTSSVANDKYIPPSRRQTHMQPSAPPPAQSHPPSNNNGPPHSSNNNSGIGRKPIYNQNQNPRNSYGGPPNAVYHQDRRNYDSRRAPPPNQYGNPGHGDLRRPPPGDDSGPRPQRMSNKVALDRKDPSKGLKEFGNTFRLQSSRLPPGNPPPTQQVGMSQHAMAANSGSGPVRNPSPPSATNTISSNKMKKDESPASLPPLIPPNNATSEPATSKPADSSIATSNPAASTTSSSSAASTSASPGTSSVANISVSESTPTSASSMTSPATSDNQTPSSTGDSKSGEAESKKKFTFNPNAKEFNPVKFTSRSPSTPPRPPSTPATAATQQQVMATQAIHPYMPLSMQPIIYQPYAQAALTPSSASSASSGVTTPRHVSHRKGELRNRFSPSDSEISAAFSFDGGHGRLLQDGVGSSQNVAWEMPCVDYNEVDPARHFLRDGVGSSQKMAWEPFVEYDEKNDPARRSVSTFGKVKGKPNLRRYEKMQISGGVVGIPPRSEMTPPSIQMTATGPPILAPATAIQAAPPHQYFVHQQGPYSVMRVVPQGVMPVFQTEGSVGTQIHPSMHYLPPNGGNAPNNTGHQPNSTPPTNPSAQTNVVPPNGHGFGQAGGSHSGSHHMGYQMVGLPVTYGFPQQHNVIQLPYVHSQAGGTTTVIPQSQ